MAEELLDVIRIGLGNADEEPGGRPFVLPQFGGKRKPIGAGCIIAVVFEVQHQPIIADHPTPVESVRSSGGLPSTAVSDTAMTDTAVHREPTSVCTAAAGAIVVAAALFGTSFVVVERALDRGLGVLPYLAGRYLVAALAFLVVTVLRPGQDRRWPWRQGALAGVTYAGAMIGQTTALRLTSASATAFLSYLLVVLVPLWLYLTTRERPTRATLAALAIAVSGLLVLTGGPRGIGRGELAAFAGAALFAIHLVQVGRAATRADLFRFNTVHCGVAAAVLAVGAPFEGGAPTGGTDLAVVTYAGLAVTFLTLVLWTWASRHLEPTRVALLYLTEPVFAAVAAVAMGDQLTTGLMVGGALILAGAALAELAGR